MTDFKCLLGGLAIVALLFCGLPYFVYRVSMAAAIGWRRGQEKFQEHLIRKVDDEYSKSKT